MSPKFPNKPVQMSRMIAYQKDSIVSRVVIGRPTATVTLFAFDKDQSLSEHTAPFDALVQVFDGQVEILIDRKPHLLKDGDSVIMPGGKPHALKAVSRFKMLLTMIRS
ncbi:MAG TPA: cupin domain-containing protein [Elusimicrobiota bacterium]|nr:cupin domain-containing protein [Elusimicrobiota bacterium]